MKKRSGFPQQKQCRNYGAYIHTRKYVFYVCMCSGTLLPFLQSLQVKLLNYSTFHLVALFQVISLSGDPAAPRLQHHRWLEQWKQPDTVARLLHVAFTAAATALVHNAAVSRSYSHFADIHFVNLFNFVSVLLLFLLTFVCTTTCTTWLHLKFYYVKLLCLMACFSLFCFEASFVLRL